MKMSKRKVLAAITAAAIVFTAAAAGPAGSAYAYIPVSHDPDIELIDDVEIQSIGANYTLYHKLSSYTAAFIDIADEAPAGHHYTVPEAIQDTGICQWFTVTEVSAVDYGGGHRHPAFAGNQWVTSVDFDEASAVESIGDGAFKGSAVANLKLPASLKTIGAGAFEGSALARLDIPPKVTSIGDRAFAAPGLQTIVFTGNAPPAALGANGSGAFAGLAPGGTVYYPAGADYSPLTQALARENGEQWKAKPYTSLADIIASGNPGNEDESKDGRNDDGEDRNKNNAGDETPGKGGVDAVASLLNSAEIFAVKDQVYTGKAATPAITVTLAGRTLSAGADYEAAYANNVKVGKATVTVTGKGGYKGTAAASFKIVPKAVTVKSLKAGKNKLTLNWAKAAGVARYQLGYKLATAKKWKTVSAPAKATGKTVGKLKKGKKYQVRIRAYKTVNGAKYYSAWSKTRTVKVR
jgi:hypothetical protein